MHHLRLHHGQPLPHHRPRRLPVRLLAARRGGRRDRRQGLRRPQPGQVQRPVPQRDPGCRRPAGGLHAEGGHLQRHDVLRGDAQRPRRHPSYATVSLWFKTTKAGGVLFYYGDKPLSGTDPVGTTTKNTPAVYVGMDGKLRGCLAMSPGCMSTITSSATVTDGKWHQAVLTGAANTQTLYLDGVSQGTLAGTINDWEQPYISLGAGVNTDGWPSMNPNDKLGHFTGQLAEVAIYSDALQPSVITAQYRAATQPAGLLNKITSPGGRVQSSVTYGTTDDLVLDATDSDGGTWKLNPATVTGSSQVYRSAVMGSAPAGYWRLGDTQGAPQAANEIHTGFGTYNSVTQGTTGPFGAGDSTAVTFNGTSSYAEIPYGPWHGKQDRAVELWFKTTKPGVLMADQNRAPTTRPASAGAGPRPCTSAATESCAATGGASPAPAASTSARRPRSTTTSGTTRCSPRAAASRPSTSTASSRPTSPVLPRTSPTPGPSSARASPSPGSTPRATSATSPARWPMSRSTPHR
ncbi:hypothetical protein GTX14_35710 [Streptomyces sp. SID4944]|nr:hypothetical protein [Streptomyces sp. SID4944]